MERKTAAEQIKESMDQTQAQSNQGSQRPRKQPKTDRKRQVTDSKALAVHQNWETMARGLAESSNARLETLASSLVANRQQQAVAFVNLMESLEDGSLDQQLVMQEWMERKNSRGSVPDTQVFEPEYDFDVEPEEDIDFNASKFDPRLKEALDIGVITAGFYQSPIKSLNAAN